MEILWQPQPRQKLVIECPFTEVLYGGAAGGGKSDCLLGDWLAHQERYGGNARGVLFRNSYPELQEILGRMHIVFGGIGAKWREKDFTWTFGNGSQLRLSYLDSFEDALKHRGNAYCVAKGSMVLMEDNSYQPIESLVPGCRILTLSGPKRVLEVHHPGLKPCVSAKVYYRGVLVGQQIHPASHPILDLSGGKWLSYVSETSSGSKDEAISHEWTDKAVLAYVQQKTVCTFVVISQSAIHGLQFDAEASSKQDDYREGSYVEFDGSYSTDDKKQLGSMFQVPTAFELDQLDQDCSTYYSPDGGMSYEERDSQIVQDSRFGYQSYPCSCDGQPHLPSDNAQGILPSLACAVEQTVCLTHGRRDDEGNAPSHNPHRLFSWVHRYTGERHSLSHDVVEGACEMTPCGDVDVYDLTVEDCNHYITSSGLVNSNTWRGHDELTMRPTDEEYVFLGSRMRSAHSIPCRTISTSNPGGPGHTWVLQHWKIDEHPAGMIPIHSYMDIKKNVFLEDASHYDKLRLSELPVHIRRNTRIFIPGRLSDNKYLDTDGHYRAHLLALPEAQRRMLLDGRWDIVEGAFFDEWNPGFHVVRAFTPPASWKRWMAMDWGTSAPYAAVWFCQSPSGEIFLYRELYGTQRAPNLDKGVKEPPINVAERILALEAETNECIQERWLDASCFDNEEMGLSVSEQFRNKGVFFQRSQKKFKSGSIAMFRDYLKVTNGMCRFHVMDNCVHVIRTLPALMVDRNNIEQYDTNGADHLLDAIIYGIRRNIKTKEELMKERGSGERNLRLIKRFGAFGAH